MGRNRIRSSISANWKAIAKNSPPRSVSAVGLDPLDREGELRQEMLRRKPMECFAFG